MKDEIRDAVNYMTALQGLQESRLSNGVRIRRVSAESLAVLELTGSPLAATFNAALNGREVSDDEPPGAAELVLMAWVHGEDADVVKRVALTCLPGYRQPAMDAALGWAREHLPLEYLAEVLDMILGDSRALQAANFDAKAPTLPGSEKKNRS